MSPQSPSAHLAASTTMTRRGVDLALGTVQFGMNYGVAGRGEAVPEGEVREILERAASAGVRLLDTAPAYGDIEARLAALIAGLPFAVVSKIGPLPTDMHADDVAGVVGDSIARSITRLGRSLTTLIFHRPEDLMGRYGDAVWRSAEAATAGLVRLGVSCYDPATLIELRRRYPIPVAQLPGNALDQRLAAPGTAAALDGVELHLRSVFLQGLLLMPTEEAVARVPAAGPALAAWAEWCRERGSERLRAALGLAQHLPGVKYCLVGVDRLEHLLDIVAAWHDAEPCSAPSLACDALDVIDPRRWGTR